MNLNEAKIIGNLTRDPELKSLESGVSVVNFGVATNRTWKDKETGAKKEEVEFHNIVVFGRDAEVINQYFKKGDQIYVSGRLQTRSWESNGVKHYRTEIIADKFEFGTKRADAAAPGDQPVSEQPASEGMAAFNRVRSEQDPIKNEISF